MAADIRTVEQQLKSVANVRRLAILRALKKRMTMTVGELAATIGLDIAPTSQHLRILRAAGVVAYKKRGQFVTYRLSLRQEEVIRAILSAL